MSDSFDKFAIACTWTIAAFVITTRVVEHTGRYMPLLPGVVVAVEILTLSAIPAVIVYAILRKLGRHTRMSDGTNPGEIDIPDSDDSVPDPSEVDWGPIRKPLDDGDPCPECGYEFDSDEWDVRHLHGGPTAGETWIYTCPGCEQETCSIGT